MFEKKSCPCCGYPNLSEPSYVHIDRYVPLSPENPPYAVHYGDPSYEVCDCCGFEFGNDDDPGTAAPISFREYLKDWIFNGEVWFSLEKRPIDWSLSIQLQAAGIPDVDK